MTKRNIVCPHCGDTWEYELIIDHTDNKCIVTKDYSFIEDGQDCVCYKCHNHYRMVVPKDIEPDMKMNDFIYGAWRRCKM